MKTNLETLEADIYHYIQWTDSGNNLSLEECRLLATALALFVKRVVELKVAPTNTRLDRVDSLADLFLLTQPEK